MLVAFDGFLRCDFGANGIGTMGTNATIFIVDDDEAVRDSLKLLLESHGCQVRDYGSTRAFLGDFRRQKRQCLIIDQHLLGETGIDFLESDDGARLQVPVILVTGGGDAALQQRARKAGTHAYFDKPIDDSRLVATIFRLLDESDSATEMAP
jgi:FixJ family two-component response regulator